MGTIYVICGLIGSGKTTYAKENYERYTDVDECEDKNDQIRKTLTLLDDGDVAHITTVPGLHRAERAFLMSPFTGHRIKYIWIDTSEEQCKKNIIKRNRPRDMADLESLIARNHELMELKNRTRVQFQTVTVF